LHVHKLARHLRAQHIEVEFTDDAVQLLAREGFDPEFGARPLRRTIQRLVENELSRLVLSGEVKPGDKVRVDVLVRGGDPRADSPRVRKGVIMRELTSDLFVTLDGFASGVDVGPYFGYFGPELDSWVQTALDQPQLIIMGRVTYEALSRISSSGTDDVSAKMNDLPKLVFSNTLQEPLAWNNTRLIRGDLANEINSLKRQPGEPLRSIGSITLVKNMMQLGLVDRLRLMVFPLILGSAGREPIYAGYSKTDLELIDTKVLDSKLVLLEYRPSSSARDD
jgi:dihydrofolate reductase